MLYTTGIVIAFFLSLLLIGKKNQTIADKLLAVWLLWTGLHLLLYYLFLSEKIYDYPALLGLTIPMPLVYPPLLLLYTTALCYGKLPKHWWWHFLPFVAGMLYLIPFLLLPAAEKTSVFKNDGEGYESFMGIMLIAINTSGIIYTYLSWQMLRRHRKNIVNQFSFTENITLDWLQNFIYGLGIIWLMVLFGNDTLIFTGAVLQVLYIGYFGIRQEGIFTSRAIPATVNIIPPDEIFIPEILPENPETELQAEAPKKYEKSGLTPAAAEALHQQLQQLMTTEQLYRESTLSLSDLAARLATHPNYLSQIINEKEGKNFYDYINTKRVEAFLDMVGLPENQRFTFFALALECGFNSKTAFNRYFKKITGQSPSDYLRNRE